MKNALMRLGVLAVTITASLVLGTSGAHAATDYSDSRLMDDQIFDNVNSMTEQQIRDFINSRPNTCLTRVGDGYGGGAIFPEPKDYWTYGPNNVDAARVIYVSAQYSGINPQVIIATMQKEQHVFTDNDCLDNQGFPTLHKVMGQGCLEGPGQPCPSAAYDGFSVQVMKGAWQLAFNRQRAEGNVNWGDNGTIVYSGPWTQGTWQACSNASQCPPVFHDGYWPIDGQQIHMDTGATASFYRFTPHLGQALPGIFEGWFGSTVVPNYSWQLTGQYSYADAAKTIGHGTQGLVPGDRVYVGFTAKNTGNVTWTNTGANPTKAGTVGPVDRNSAFCDSSWGFGCNRPAVLKEASVAPGATGTFEFWMTAPTTPGTYDEHFDLVIDGKAWLPDQGLNFHMTVVPAVYSWQLTSQYAYADQTKTAGHGTQGLMPGDRVYVGFTAKNTGNVTWSNSGAHPINVGETHPQDRNSLFYDPTWLGYNRPARLKEASVPPGGTGTFEFWMNAPAGAGTYPEYFSLVSEGASWFNDPGMNFYSTVVPAVYSWQFVGQYAYTDQTKTAGKGTIGLHPGDRVYVGFVAKNTGNVTWHNTGNGAIHVGMTHPQDRNSLFYDPTWLGYNRPAQMKESSVPPGGLATFEYWMNAPSTVGTYPEYFSLLAEHVTWMNDPGMNFYSTVTH